MKKILVLVCFFCLVSLVNATMLEEPFSKEDFKDRLNLAVNHNRQQVSILISSGYFDPPVGLDSPAPTREEQQKEITENLNKLESLKEEAIKEYIIFYDAYHKADLIKVQAQNIKLKAIFDEMNPLMHTVVKFEGIYNNVFYWTIKLEYLIEKGIINPDNPPIDNSKPITATIDKGSGTPIDDCCVLDPNSDCCKAKVEADCCILDPDSDCCKEKPQNNLLIPIAVALVIIVSAIVYVAFIRKN